ncbi:response regulator [Variovorax arabinosiphilus]|uniref:response regulator n=1 Tax=Variovorax arabinosiphilus TaxID=3053498 RepID=UPI002578764A|nr:MULTISPECIES: response regulator [unclassified Variovorax]MDM0119453.1 response regulator [Variovorax sp. J2L1-78]MDM0129879.1 response regulator [Variovorax sp. J2L1-63]MDM0232335.1 response regulator [Variovorax sp. J2R1-6]
MTRILIVEDEPDIASVLQDYLRHQGYDTEHIADGQLALARIQAAPPDLTLLDVMLPRLDGLAVLRGARARSDAPVIMLTARTEEVDRLIGLELGADDYICKPFSPREVVARVRAVLRRTAQAAVSNTPPCALTLDEEQWSASLHGEPLNLTRREFRLLQALARHPGRIFSRGQLLELAYEPVDDVTERAVDSHVKNLRRKLAALSPTHDWIRSVYGIGFSLETPDT